MFHIPASSPVIHDFFAFVFFTQGIDVKNRPSDQNYHCRIYSRIDDDVWERGELRGWYQQYSKPQPRDVNDNVKSGYSLYSKTLGLTHSASAPVLQTHTSSTIGPGLTMRAESSFKQPHFMDFEANLTHQKATAENYMKEKRGFPPEPVGVARVPGFRQAPWKDRPTG